MITYVITGIVLLVYLVLAWFAGVWLHKTGGEFALLFGLLSVLGVAGAAIFLWYRRKMLGPALPAGASPLASEVDLLVNEAERRLRASRIPGDPSIGNLPLVFVLGDPNTTKTSTILHSGLEPELLAGQVSRDADVTATRSANIWVASKTLFVEVGGQLQADSIAFARLIKRLQPKRLKAAVGGKQQAPRAAVMCFDCEQFVSAGSTDAIPAAARRLGSQLKEISQSFGITLPVYVLFTKADRVPNFADYVNGFTNDEAGQVLGATLRFRANVNVGVYGEEATRQLGTAYDQLLLSLGEHRLEYLARENTTEHLGGIYEFPRELKKLRQQVVQFLVDLGRPSELSTNPFIRGFYFSGVRAVMVDEMSSAPVQMQAQQVASGADGATKMFKHGVRGLESPIGEREATGEL